MYFLNSLQLVWHFLHHHWPPTQTSHINWLCWDSRKKSRMWQDVNRNYKYFLLLPFMHMMISYTYSLYLCLCLASPSILQQTALPILSLAQCQQYWGNRIFDSMICAGASGVSSCQVSWSGLHILKHIEQLENLGSFVIMWLVTQHILPQNYFSMEEN